MASVPAFIASLQPYDGRDPVTLNNIARALRPEYITTASRGAGAASIDFWSAANIILSFWGADSAKSAPAAVQIFSAMTSSSRESQEPLEVLSDLAKIREFGPALRRLIEGVPEIMIAGWEFIQAAKFPGDPIEHFKGSLSGDGPLWVEVSLSQYFARIELFENRQGGKESFFFENYYSSPDVWRRAYKLGLRTGIDKKVTVKFGIPTLVAAWGAVTNSVVLDDPETFIEASVANQ